MDSLRAGLGIAAAVLLILLSSWRGARVTLAPTPARPRLRPRQGARTAHSA